MESVLRRMCSYVRIEFSRVFLRTKKKKEKNTLPEVRTWDLRIFFYGQKITKKITKKIVFTTSLTKKDDFAFLLLH